AIVICCLSLDSANCREVGRYVSQALAAFLLLLLYRQCVECQYLFRAISDQSSEWCRLLGMSVNPAKVVALTQQGRPTDQQTKDEAFRLWIEQGRSWTAVSRHTGIAVRTLHYWGEADNWEQRRATESAAFMPGKKVETAVALRLAAHNSAVKLQQISHDYL